MDNKFHIGYDTYTPFLLGSYPALGVDNGRWGIEYWDAAGGLNFWIPFPNPNSQNNVLFLQDVTANVGIGTSTPNYKLDVWGDIATYSVYLASDAKLKTNIQPIANNQINKLYQLQGKTYSKKLNQPMLVTNGITDTVKLKTIQAQNARNLANNGKQEFGYLAQEIQQLYPELVSGDTSSHLSVNYIGLIPIIIEALKEQYQTVNDLKQQLNQCCPNKQNNNTGQLGKKGTTIPTSNNENTESAYLLQNVPNPFSENTSISYNIPENSQKASLHVYDMQGSEIKNFEIKQRGEGKAIIYGSELKAGMYMYTLIIDNKEVDTKRMILTK
ncbi:MAG: tail fiber domain-containing protein [Bacteroidia bacterium]|nr:tail fiber domain-containing protein [Bacteroidia bacterium]MBW7844499.1 tail fiber domain-containing protein [Bacteroidia bacterium]MCC7534434.1 tail fiber domain-containing protein [Bacteroidia bacterium]